jgi:hypothetical protein
MTKKKHHKSTNSDEAALHETIRFFTTHTWAGPRARPIDVHPELDPEVAIYFLDTYIWLEKAKVNFRDNNIKEAKKDLTISYVWKCEACYMANYNNSFNHFTYALLHKTEDILDDAIEAIFADECPARKDDETGFHKFKLTLEDREWR